MDFSFLEIITIEMVRSLNRLRSYVVLSVDVVVCIIAFDV